MTARQVRVAFWFDYTLNHRKPRKYHGLSQNQLPADVRIAFVEYVDRLRHADEITERVAAGVTL